MISQDFDELVLVLRLEQVFDRARRELGKRFIGRGEDRERTGALEGVYQSTCLERGRDRFEIPRRHRGVHDVLFRRLTCRRNLRSRQKSGRGHERREDQNDRVKL